uniref:Peptidase M41 domain-containing protein n=1 Tax=Ditylum brightwellii TaxID=49249 RepID=A0A6U3NQB2_9STRA|mmetsp:Transcript_10859/g.16170  ORF Transcript_10859/g.16170 Transcript_10859/m.16170 type:complete len:414 (+) Transcript_10859:192-1433(+)
MMKQQQQKKINRRMTAVKTAAAIAAASILTAAPTTTNAFVVPTANTAIAFRQSTKLRMSSTEDEVAKLRAAAEKMRAEANALAKEMGKDISDTASTATKTVEVKSLGVEEISALTSSIDFEGGDAKAQTERLDALVQSGNLSMWKSAVTGSAGTASPAPLRPFPCSLQFLESRSGGKLTAENLGVGGESDVSLDDFKDATIAVVLGSTALAIASLVFLPENIGATLCYLFALIPVGFIGIGSTAPGIIAGGIAALRGEGDDNSAQDDRVCRHEAGHFLCGYLAGLPVKGYSIADNGYPCVEFHPSPEGDSISGRGFNEEEIAALSVVAMSGSVAEAMALGKARGGENDLLELDNLFRKSNDFLGAAKQQDLTRWGALAAYNLINGNKEKYECLVQAFKDKKSVAECVAIIESR